MEKFSIFMGYNLRSESLLSDIRFGPSTMWVKIGF
jgi:hypothetical protein